MTGERYQGPAVVAAGTARIPVRTRLSRTSREGPWRGRMWTDDAGVDLEDLARAKTRMLWIGDRASSFTVDRVHEGRADVTGPGHAPF